MDDSLANSSPEENRYTVGDRVSVLLPLPLAGAYDYRVPDGESVAVGDIVAVPLGRRQMTGVVRGAGSGEVPEAKMRDLVGRLESPPLPPVCLRFVDWVAGYTLSPSGAVLRMVLSIPDALSPPKPIAAYALGTVADDLRVTPGRRRVLAVVGEGPPRVATELAREAGVGPAVVHGLAKAGALVSVDLPPPPPFEAPEADRPGPTLSTVQAEAAADLVDKARHGGFGVTLLDGVPGSGKTEVYFEAVAEALRQGRQALVLLPEIALSAQWLARFRRRFGVEPAVWHSDLTQAQRRTTWRAVAEGSARVVVGARSALFLPYPELGLIVVDEEHEAAFKQEDGVVYHARDMAVVRASLGGIPIVLASATPSLESVVNVRNGRYDSLHLPDRHNDAVPPAVEVIDMRRHPPPRGQWLSPGLRQVVSETLAAGEQAMLFLNRRGYAPLTLCRACGHRMQCPRCTAWLVEHRLVGRLQCHHCGFLAALPRECPECEAEDALTACGPGVERLAEEVAEAFPDARLTVAASDTLVRPRDAAELVRRIEEYEVDIIVGTQIVAKGYHFPLLTLVGVVDADLGLAGGDLRAAERTYQLLYQVAGRAGREARPGRVLLQTYRPDEAVMTALAAGDRDRFVEAEIADREVAAMPPFGRLAALIVSGRDERAVEAAARALGRAAPRDDRIQVFGPAPAPLALLRGRHRRRLLLKAPRNVAVQPLLRRWLAAASVPNTVKVRIDIDPYSFL